MPHVFKELCLISGARRGDGKHCDLCGSSAPAVRCDRCASQIFCVSCDDMYHRHPKRQTHVRKVKHIHFDNSNYYDLSGSLLRLLVRN